MGRNNSVSPIRADGSPRRRSPSRRERSPSRHRSSNADRLSSRIRSPKRARSRSPAFHSPVREKSYSRTKSPNHRKSPSHSPVRHKQSSRMRSPKHEKSRSSPPLSPRSKRLKRAKAERDAEKGSEREHENNHVKKGDRAIRDEKDLERDLPIEKKDTRPGRDAAGNGSRLRHDRSYSPSDRHHRGQRRSRSPYAADNRGHNELTNSGDTEQRNGGRESLAKMKAVEETLEAKEKAKPSFELSGKLAAETNRVRGVTLLFNEPPDARKPDIRWRLYVFKGGEVLNEPLYVHRQSCYLLGRERRVADIPTDHPSCSKQHAVLQYRQVEEDNPDGTMSKRVRPYLMDLGSTNGTFINDDRIEPQRYYELFEKDTIKFGNSSWIQMGSEIETVEQRLKSFTNQLHTECGILERLVYKHKNQHRRCSYFQYILKVRRDLKLLKLANLDEILDASFLVINGNRPKQKVQLLESLKRRRCGGGKYNFLERLLGVTRLLSQMVEPLLKAAMEISTLLARSFFMKFSLTILAVLARIRVLVQQMLLDAILLYNNVSSLSQREQTVKLNQEGFEVFREYYPRKEEANIMLECIWQTDKYVLVERTYKSETTSQEKDDRGDLSLSAPKIQYQNIEVLLGAKS